VTLTGILDGIAGKTGAHKGQVFAGSKGKAASIATEKAHDGQAPAGAAAGEQNPEMDLCSLAPMDGEG
jgi:hypothetical protein